MSCTPAVVGESQSCSNPARHRRLGARIQRASRMRGSRHASDRVPGCLAALPTRRAVRNAPAFRLVSSTSVGGPTRPLAPSAKEAPTMLRATEAAAPKLTTWRHGRPRRSEYQSISSSSLLQPLPRQAAGGRRQADTHRATGVLSAGGANHGGARGLGLAARGRSHLGAHQRGLHSEGHGCDEDGAVEGARCAVRIEVLNRRRCSNCHLQRSYAARRCGLRVHALCTAQWLTRGRTDAHVR